ncbi:HlyD family type I secretion periplasmic adaptor subunit [Nisaea denitrificans]|uniref:HlyD family type I secretion periplasmic adaptor subunit n=1 Tax=Nisaea denitrificans TaxID=390877 RepID=UPI00041A949D|nr:HlyD family type I secretion periplasmic adaptor subunit [Nisaea denitrificans]
MADTLPALDGDFLTKRLPIKARDVDVNNGAVGGSQLTKQTWHRSSLFGWSVLFAFFVLFGGWSVVAPLASAVRAPGKLHVASEPQVVQHFEGGIVDKILVHEGDTVEKDQVLVQLNPLSTDAQIAQLENRLFALLAERARLRTERDGLSKIEFPAIILKQKNDPEISGLIHREEILFQKQMKSLNDQKQLIAERISQYQTQIDGSIERLASINRQIEIVEEELTGVRTLFDKGLERKPRVLSLERGQEQLRGAAAQLKSTIAQYKQAINEQDLRLAALENQRETEISSRLRENALQLNDIQEQENVWRDRLNRIQIKAPMSGQIVNLNIHTTEGVIRPGETLMTIIPTEDELLVSAKIDPKDIDVLLIGAPVQLQLSAFNPRTTPPIEGTLTSVSADAVTDGRSSKEFFEARIVIDPESLSHNLPGVRLTAGMTVSSLISVGERTLFEYIVTPLSQSLSQAMREP